MINDIQIIAKQCLSSTLIRSTSFNVKLEMNS